jgi:DNA-binding response OmpR family regulator
MEGAVRQLLAEGALAVLHKPFDMATLVATVQQLTAEQQAEPAERS